MGKRFIESDYKEIAHWFQAWGVTPPPIGILSDIGIIVPGVAAGFLYLTNSQMGIIDCLVSNPDASKEERNHAIHLIGERLLEMARSTDCIRVKCNTRIGSVMERAKQFGFVETGEFTCLTKEMSHG